MRRLSFLAFSVLCAGASAQSYRLIDLGPRSGAAAITPSGRPVGTDQGGFGGGRPVVWSADGTSRQALGGLNGRGATVRDAAGEHLVVGGGSRFNDTPYLALRWTNEGAPDPFLGEAATSEAYGADASGRITGVRVDGGAYRAFLWSEGAGASNLPLPTGYDQAVATAISDSGRVFGYADTFGITHGGFLWTWTAAEGTRALASIRPQDRGFVHGANASGMAVGQVAEGSRAGDAVVWDAAGNPTQIFAGTVGSEAWGINGRGDVVGSWREGDGFDHARLRTAGGTKLRLSDVTTGAGNWLLETATDINDRGEIVGYGNFSGSTHGFKLVPVPEPLTVVALGGGLAALARRRRR